MFLSNCVVRVMRVWLLPAVLSPLAKQHIRYGVTQLTPYRIRTEFVVALVLKHHARVSAA